MYRFYRFLLFIFFKVCYRNKVTGEFHLPKGPCILAANHASFLDPPLLAGSTKEDLYFIAKIALFKRDFFSNFLKRLHAYPISGNASDLKTFKLVCGLIQEGKKIVIFPEGHRSHDGKIHTIKPGTAMIALKMDCPIIPVYLQGTFAIWPRNKRFPKMKGKTSCHFGEPIYPNQYSHLSKKEAQENLSKAIQKGIQNLIELHEKE